MYRFRIPRVRVAFVLSLAVASFGFCSSIRAGVFLVNQRNASTIWQWDSQTGQTQVFHQVRANDADVNTPQGSEFGWIVEHNTDHFGRFVPGSGQGLDRQFILGQEGRQHYHYPKHVTVFNGEVVVMSRNDGTLWRYDENGVELGNKFTGQQTGQGMATDGGNLFVSTWNGQSSAFVVFDPAFNVVGNFPNPSGLGPLINVFDIAFDPATGNFFGLAATFEQGTLTESDIVVEFQMGGALVRRYQLPFLADGIGQLIRQEGCPDIELCENINKFKAKCIPSDVRGKFRLVVSRITFQPNPDRIGRVLVAVNREPFCLEFGDQKKKVKLTLFNRTGQQVAELLLPPNCRDPIIRDCGP